MTRVALLWHMHQPFYQDLATGEHILPWVRLHALKDYYGMVAMLREFPDVRVTFNLVPSMLVQLEAFARDEARDRHLEIGLKPADTLTEDEHAFCIQHFFHAYAPRMIEPYPRYAELLAKRGQDGSGLSARSQTAQFTVEDFRDLQVWHKLAWVDPSYFTSDDRVRRLVAKGRSYTEDDKAALRAIELELLRAVIPEYRAASARGQIELSTSPFYHPILPLLCDTDVYLRTHPHSRMPREPFRHPEDAVEQLARAVDLHKRLFGDRPQGLWPSEGSVSDAMVPLVASGGFRWMATDEEILARTIGQRLTRDASGHLEQPDVLYTPYTVGESELACVFRDRVLSDLIGFTYPSWSAEDAAEDLLRRLVEGGRRYTEGTGKEATIAVILDGENAWERYEGGGRPFLRALYGRLARHADLSTVAMSAACGGADRRLPTIFPGSWINGDFYIWIGHEDDRRAWSQLADARNAVDASASVVSPSALARAREELLIAEGSDWFWWYGDDHSSEHDPEFDDLFRRHVRNAYRALERPVPEELFVSNITTAPPEEAISPATGLIHPTIDGEITSYFEWVGAGCLEVASVGGAMHRTSEAVPDVTVVEFGFDLDALYIRLDGTGPMQTVLNAGLEVALQFLKPAGIEIAVAGRRDVPAAQIVARQTNVRPHPIQCDDLQVRVGAVLEIALPFACVGLKARDAVAFIVTLRRNGVDVEHYPTHRPIEFQVPTADFGTSQ